MLTIVRHKNKTFFIAAVFAAASIVSLIVFGLKPGIDLTGGSLMEVSFSKDRPAIEEVQKAVEPIDLGTVLVQPIDEDSMLLKTRFISEDEHQNVLGALRSTFETGDRKVYEDRLETIGPAVSAHLRQRLFWANILVILSIVAYIAYVFRKVSAPVQSWKYGIVSIIALVFNVLITAGVFALLGHYKGVEVDIQFMVALLTILGYSVNDTIVVFDRIREHLMKGGKRDFLETVNNGINETLTRSLNISLAILLVLCALFFFGGDSIHYFSLALIIGTVVGSWTSIFLASPLLVAWQEWSSKRA